MVLSVALHPLHATRQVGVVAALQLVLVDVGLGAVALHHPYMWEVISETEEHHIDRDMEVGRANGLGGHRWASSGALGGAGEGSVASGLWGHGSTCYIGRFRMMTLTLRQKYHKCNDGVRNSGVKADY